MANPINNYPSKDLTQHREQRNLSVVVAGLVITLPLPERDIKAPLPISWDDACVPEEHGTPCNDMSRAFPPVLGSSAWMPRIPGALPHFSRFTAVCVSTNESFLQLLGGSAIGKVTLLTSNSTADGSALYSC